MVKVTDFIGKMAKYDEHGQNIFGIDKNLCVQNIADVRGWGAIQNLFKNKDGSIRFDEAKEFQDELGKWIANAINEKLERDIKNDK